MCACVCACACLCTCKQRSERWSYLHTRNSFCLLGSLQGCGPLTLQMVSRCHDKVGNVLEGSSLPSTEAHTLVALVSILRLAVSRLGRGGGPPKGISFPSEMQLFLCTIVSFSFVVAFCFFLMGNIVTVLRKRIRMYFYP